MITEDFKKYYSSLITIALPIILGNIAHILIGTTDVLVASKHSIDTLASISIASSIIMCLFIFGIGLLSGITPVISNFLGAGKPAKKCLLSTINYSQLMAFIFFIITVLLIPLVDLCGFEAHLVPAIKEYLFVVSFSYFGAYLHFALKEFLQAYEILTFPNLLSFIAVILNLVFNLAFVFGFCFIPSMGVIGIAIATLLVRTLMGLILLIYCKNMLSTEIKLDFTYIKQLLKVGYPISIALLLEFFAFNIITLIMAREAGIYAAAQSIIITITSVTFMVPLAMSNAIAIKVGYSNGARDYNDIKRFSVAGTSITTIFMAACAVILFLFPKELLSLMTHDTKLLEISIPIVMIAGIFQIFDGLQVSFSGILKGLKKTLFVTSAIILGYWCIGLPVGAILAFKFNMKLMGFWYGLLISLICLSLYMSTILFFIFKKLKKEYN